MRPFRPIVADFIIPEQKILEIKFELCNVLKFAPPILVIADLHKLQKVLTNYYAIYASDELVGYKNFTYADCFRGENKEALWKLGVQIIEVDQDDDIFKTETPENEITRAHVPLINVEKISLKFGPNTERPLASKWAF